MPPHRDPLVYLPPLLWALNVVASRAAMGEIRPEWGSFLRFALALPCFILLLGRLPQVRPLGQSLFLALGGVALFSLVFFHGIRLAPASDAAAVGAVYPLSTALAYSLYFRRPLSRPLLLGLLLSGSGVVWLALAQGGAEGGHGRLLGILLLVLAATLWGAYSVGVALAVRRRSPLEVTAASMLLGSLLLLPLALPHPFPEAGPTAWLALLYTALGGAFLAFTLWGLVLQRHPASRVAPFLNLTPALALLFAALLLGETPRAAQLPGLLLIALGVYWSQRG
ncbi:DMT family transporter [Thermus thermamylovorans]|uniref:DMT family transporter n=1 Tax=Thermus thermamylovorans TaxID=2509362 RepID=A0A4Q9B569_9DEIN|nr:DMT family transporter [Thermus thermamylovorans]TBH21001.1 DMT family transporter [Thermus thermamylovorans]